MTNYFEPHLSCFKQNEVTTYLNNFTCDRCFCTLQTIVPEIEENNNFIKVYPNPANSNIYIDFELKNGLSEIGLFNTFGTSIEIRLTNSFPIQMNIKELPVGIYLVQIKNDGFIYREKFIKTE